MKETYKKSKICYVLKLFSFVCTILVFISMIFIVGYILINGVSKLNFQLLFGRYGEYPSIVPATIGTLKLIFIALLIAVPLSVFSAVFTTEYVSQNSKFLKIVRVATETLAGIPSIVYGLFGYLVFVVAFKWGYTILGGGVTLAIMILPTIQRSAEESILAVPKEFRECSFALGAGKVRTIFKVVLPSAKSGIITAIILAINRVVSESAVLILTIGLVVENVPVGIMTPGTSLALDIYYFGNMGYQNEASATAVALIVLVLLLNLLASLVSKPREKGDK